MILRRGALLFYYADIFSSVYFEFSRHFSRFAAATAYRLATLRHARYCLRFIADAAAMAAAIMLRLF